MNKALAIGCAVVLLLIGAVVGVAIWQGPKLLAKGKGLVQDAMAKGARISAMENGWQPPSTEPDASWFPDEVGNWKLERSEPTSSARELNIERKGHRATYRSGAGLMEVLVVPANDLEKGEMIDRISNALGSRPDFQSDSHGVKVSISGGSSSMTTTLGNRTTIQRNGERAQFWWIKGWLFIFRPRGEADPEVFSDAYIGGMLPVSPQVESKQ